MKNEKFILLGVLFALLAISVIACGGTAASSPPSPEGVPEGTYLTKAGEVKDIQLTLENGRFTIIWYGHVEAKGPYASTKDLVVFAGEPVQGEALCNDSEEPGIYKWAVQGKQLTFTKVQDFCVYRNLSLTTQPLTKK